MEKIWDVTITKMGSIEIAAESEEEAIQWRLQYARVIALDNTVNGVLNYEW